MPGYNCFRFHDEQGLGPARPHRAECDPEQSIDAAQFGTALFPFVHSKLLSKCDRFQREFMPSHDESADVRERRHCERIHQSMLVNQIRV